MSISEQLANFVVNTHFDDIPTPSLAVLQGSILDYYACAMAGEQEPVGQALRAYANSQAGPAEATVFGQHLCLPAKAAAMVNGACAHALDYDDTHFDYIGHTSVAVLPAAIAMAQKQAACGQDFLLAAQIGVEVACRVGAYLGRSHYEAGYHQTATAGSFGAAAAAAKLLGLSQSQCVQMFGLLSSRASGLKNQFGTMGKPFNAGMAASNGVEIALLIAHGLDSVHDGLEGPFAFAQSHHGEAHEQALDSLGREYRFDFISHKFHACCHGTHAALEGLLQLLEIPEVDNQRLAKLVFKVHPRWLKVCNKPQPQSGLEAKFSYRMVAAMVLTGLSTADPLAYQDDLHLQPDLQAAMDKIEVEGIEGLADTQAEVLLTTVNGATYQTVYDCGQPLRLDELMLKLHVKARVLVGREQADKLAAWVRELPDLPHIL